MIKKRVLWWLIVWAIGESMVSAQTLSEVMDMAESVATAMRVEEAKQMSAEEEMKQAKAGRLPDVNLGVGIGFLGNGVITDRDFSNHFIAEIPHFGNNFALSTQQIIYAGGALKAAISLAETKKEMADLAALQKREDVRYGVCGEYLELCKLQNEQKVVDANLVLMDSVVKDMKVRMEQGTALANDVTRYELQRERLALQRKKIESAIKVMNMRLTTTLHLNEGEVIETIIPETIEQSGEVSVDNVLAIKMSDKETDIKEHAMNIERGERRPKIFFVAEDHLDGPITIDIPAIDKNFNYWYLSLRAQWTPSAFYKKKHELKEKEFEIEESKQKRNLLAEQIANEIYSAQKEIEVAESEIKTCEKSVALALSNYETIYTRYQNDMVLLTDLLDATNVKLESEIGLVNARLGLLWKLAHLKYICGNL